MGGSLANFWSNLFDKLGVFGLLIASAAPIVLLGLVVAVVALIIVPLIRRITKNKPKQTPQAEKPQPPKKPQQPKKVTQPKAPLSAEELYQQAKNLPLTSLENRKKAFGLYLQSANMGHFAAQCQVGIMYYNGNGTGQNLEESLRWLRKSAEQGGIYARIVLAQIYSDDKKNEDPGEVLDWLIPVAQEGDADAQYLLYRLYAIKQEYREKAMGYKGAQWKDDPLCLEWSRQGDYWLEQAALNGHSEAEYLFY